MHEEKDVQDYHQFDDESTNIVMELSRAGNGKASSATFDLTGLQVHAKQEPAIDLKPNSLQ